MTTGKCLEELYNIYKEHPRIATDSRSAGAGMLFFALKGASFDGNKFAGAALEKGCRYAIVDEKEYAGDERIILVNNCLETLQQLANYHRRTLKTPVIGITGTNGKTTTKELVAAVLSQKFNVLYTQGNLNNHIGAASARNIGGFFDYREVVLPRESVHPHHDVHRHRAQSNNLHGLSLSQCNF